MKNVILGIDSDSFEQLNPLLKKKILPNFKKILDEGYPVSLKVTTIPITVPSWPGLFSGRIHPQLGFNIFSVLGKEVFNSTHWRERVTFSNLLLKSFVLDVSGSYPTWKINGEMLIGIILSYLSTYPEELKKNYEKNWIIAGHTVEDVFQEFYIKQKIFFDKLKDDFALLIFVIIIPDHISHLAGFSLKNAFNYFDIGYMKIDKFLGQFLDSRNYNNFFIFSDHELTRYKKIFYFHSWNNKKGFYNLSNESKEKIWKNIFLKIYDLFRPIFTPTNKMLELYSKYFETTKKGIKKHQNSGYEKKRIKAKASFVVPGVMNLRIFEANIGGLHLYGKFKQKKEQLIIEFKKEKYVKKVIDHKVELFPNLYNILDERYFFSIEISLFVKRKKDLLIYSFDGLFIAYRKNIIHGKTDSVYYFDIASTILISYGIKKKEGMVGNH